MSIAIMLTFVYKDKNLFPDEKSINDRDYRAGWCMSLPQIKNETKPIFQK